ncbi:hypothetical protein CVT26_004090 [Gymnopilus dilepis]|uniref:Protein kinase domain-containing protein n=1 Tax=Gymnopilus dilepis TaxID=231916 RepID=A0A409W295_9AGAR|nr:hypothetical protein CVT26_004090 [Gymnopilus dilepis]
MQTSTWSSTGSPRYLVGEVLHSKFSFGDYQKTEWHCPIDIVTSIKHSAKAFQILDVKDRRSDSQRIIKVLSRSLAKDSAIAADIYWLRHVRTIDEQHSFLEEEFRDMNHHYLVFHPPKNTLRDVLDSPFISPLPRRHVQEIGLQLINTVHSLHKEYIYDLDLCPENIEILSTATNTEYEYTRPNFFQSRAGLPNLFVMQELMINSRSYFNVRKLNWRQDAMRGSDQYRSPEIVFGWKYKYRSDCFAIGCIIWEMLTGIPLFIACEEGPRYQLDKAYLFEDVLGPYPESFTEKLKRQHSHYFPSPHSNHLIPSGYVSETVQNYLSVSRRPEDILVEDEEALDVVMSLTRLNAKQRPTARDILDYKFFKRRSF